MSSSSANETGGFGQFNLDPAVLQAIDEIGYEQPSPIQSSSIPALLGGRDLLGQAQTGTGKTAAFALPLLSRLDLSKTIPQILVLAPTRELAIQVAEAFQTYARHLKGFHVLPIYGGQHIGEQLRALKRGVHVVVGTPGRVIDHLTRKTLDLSQLQAVVLDEADEMLRMGFVDDVEQILEGTPKQKQVALFSATLPKDIRRIAEHYLENPERVSIQTKTSTVELVRQRYVQVKASHKLDALTRILEVERFDGLLIFARTKTATTELSEKLAARGYSCSALNGDMNQAHRETTVSQLKRGTIDIVVATDVAARGLDVNRISHVINYDIPSDTEAYVHRIGRTGRAGRSGEAILFVSPREMYLLKSIERATRQSIEGMHLPSREDLADRRVLDFKTRISEAIESEELGYFLKLIDSYSEEHDTENREVAAALAYLLQKDRPLVPNEKEIIEHHKQDFEPRRGRSRGSEGRPSGQERGRQHRPVENGMTRYRIDVGREHGVQPGNIVGAIANEAGLSSRDIGQIHFHQVFSTVDLPQGLSTVLQRQLQSVMVCGRPLKLREWREDGPPARGKEGPPSRKDGPRARRKDGPPSRGKDGPPSRGKEGPWSRGKDDPPSRGADGPRSNAMDPGSDRRFGSDDGHSLRLPAKKSEAGDSWERPKRPAKPKRAGKAPAKNRTVGKPKAKRPKRTD